MKVLITGGEGQLSKCLQNLLIEHGISFKAPTRQQLDIVRSESIEKFMDLYQPTVVINTAAYTAVDKAESESLLAYSVNSDAVASLAHICVNRDIKLIHISTDYVFDGTLNQFYSENSATNPLSVYGKSKLSGEQRFISSGVSGLIVRTSWLYSEYAHNFMKTILRLASERKELTIVSDQIGTPTYAGDLSKFLLHMLKRIEKNKNDSGIVHFANQGVASWYDFAFEICSLANISVNVEPLLSIEYPTPAVRPQISVLDCRKAGKDFGFVNRHWKLALIECLQKYHRTYVSD